MEVKKFEINSGEPSTLQKNASLLHQDPCADGLARKGSSDPVPSQVMQQTSIIYTFMQFE
jgi:hypothetical protein